MSGLLSRVDRMPHAVLPLGGGFALLLLALAPWPSPLLHALFDVFPLVFLCAFAMRAPGSFPAYATFLMGLLYDALSGHFLGVTALSWLLADLLLRGRRLFFPGESFGRSWRAFALALFVAGLLQWALFGLLARHPGDLLPFALRLLFGALLFPPMAGLAERLQDGRE